MGNDSSKQKQVQTTTDDTTGNAVNKTPSRSRKHVRATTPKLFSCSRTNTATCSTASMKSLNSKSNTSASSLSTMARPLSSRSKSKSRSKNSRNIDTTSSHVQAILLRRKRQQLMKEKMEQKMEQNENKRICNINESGCEGQSQNLGQGSALGEQSASSGSTTKENDAIVEHKISNEGHHDNKHPQKESNADDEKKIIAVSREEKEKYIRRQEAPVTGYDYSCRGNVEINTQDEDAVDEESVLTSNKSINSALRSISTAQSPRSSRSMSANFAAQKKSMKEDEMRYRLKRITKSDNKKFKEQEMRDKLNKLKKNGVDQEEKQEISKEIDHHEMKKMRESIQEKNSLIEGQQRMIEELSNQLETLSRQESLPDEVNVKKSRGLREMASSPSRRERPLYPGYYEGSGDVDDSDVSFLSY